MNTCILCSKNEGEGFVDWIICSNCLQKLLPLDNNHLKKLSAALREKDRIEAADWIETMENIEEAEGYGTSGKTRKLYQRENATRDFRNKQAHIVKSKKKGITLYQVE